MTHDNKFNWLRKIHNYIFLLLSILASTWPYSYSSDVPILWLYLSLFIAWSDWFLISLLFISFLFLFGLFFFFQNQFFCKICFYNKWYVAATDVQVARKISSFQTFSGFRSPGIKRSSPGWYETPEGKPRNILRWLKNAWPRKEMAE